MKQICYRFKFVQNNIFILLQLIARSAKRKTHINTGCTSVTAEQLEVYVRTFGPTCSTVNTKTCQHSFLISCECKMCISTNINNVNVEIFELDHKGSLHSTLNLLWTDSEPTLNILWTYSDYTLNILWTYSEQHL